MSGAEAIVGVVSGGAGLISLGIQLGESALKLKAFYDRVKRAPETVKKLAAVCETMSLSLERLERYRQEEPASIALLMRCIRTCDESTVNLQGMVQKIERWAAKFASIGRVYTAFMEPELEELLDEMERAKSSLHLALDMYHAEKHSTQLRQISATLAALVAQQGQGLLAVQQHSDSGHLSVVSSGQRAGQYGSHNLSGEVVVQSQQNPQHETRRSSRATTHVRQKRGFHVTFGFRLLTSQVWGMTVTHASCGWNLALRTFNECARDSKVMQFCRAGDITGIQRLVAAGEASLLDRNGFVSLLWVSNIPRLTS